jgi:stage III sporulation protein AG
MNFFKRISEMLESKNRKKLIENAVVIIIIGIIIIIAGGVFFSGNKAKPDQDIPSQGLDAVETGKSINAVDTDATEEKLKAILSQMEGVGKVDVMITYTAGKENVPAYDIKKNESSTNEKDSGGGTRNISQSEYNSTIVYEDQNGGKQPVITKEIQPVVKGVVVVAEGAASPQVRERIINAVQVLTDVPIHKVQVVERKK